MRLPHSWKISPGPRRTWSEGLSLSRQVTRLLLAAGSLLLLLIIAQLGALTVNRMISTRLVEQRIAPMSQLQTIASAYQTSWAIADKVRIGTIDATGGATALRDIQARLGEDWRELDEAAPEITAQFAGERPDADKALARLQVLLEAGDRDRLDFFLSGQFFGGVDPLLGRIARATEQLRATATQDRAVLRWVNFAAELLLLAVTIGAIAGGTLIAHLGETRMVRPLAAIAEHLRRTDRDAVDAVPGTDRHDEIGAIAQALAQADAQARQAERARQEQQRTEEALRHREQEEALRRRELEEALHAKELDEARTGQARARLVDSHFARFDAVLSQLVGALGSASTTMRDMATTLASTSAQSRDMADSVARSVSAAAARIDEVQRESLGLLTLVTDVRGSAATTRTHSSDMIEQSGHNRAQAQTLSGLVGGISRALGLIQGIAAQTNLLSVNANIEAHRSGAAGAGFTVVAREIKTLAIDSSQAAGEIARQLALVNHTAGDFLASASLVEALATRVGEQADSVEALAGSQESASQRMAASIADTRSEIREITASALEARSGSAELVDAAGQLLDTADTIARQIGDLNAEFTALRANLSAAA
jgi:methyl-accepting chemotaxis protein